MNRQKKIKEIKEKAKWIRESRMNLSISDLKKICEEKK